MTKKSFDRAAHSSANYQREGKPNPAKLAANGIKTPESLAWLEGQSPDAPQLTHEIDNADLRQSGIEDARENRRQAIQRFREAFRQSSRKARADFTTARDYRQQDRER